MRFHLVTVEGTQQFDETWTIAPLVPLRTLPPTLIMPMAGDELELRLPDGPILTAIVESFGVDAWQDEEGNFYTNMDPSDPSLTLTIRYDSGVGEIPPGTEIWLSNASSGSGSDAS
jgi:hypothetical protein